jgi:hypothetical protein
LDDSTAGVGCYGKKAPAPGKGRGAPALATSHNRLGRKPACGHTLSSQVKVSHSLRLAQAVQLANYWTLDVAVDEALSAPYRSGPSRDWFKIKNPDSPAMVRHREGNW